MMEIQLMVIARISTRRYVGYGAWFSIWGDETWDDGNTKNGDGWKQIDYGLRSGSPSFFWICSSSVSPCFGNRASSFWNEGIPDPDQIGSGDGCSSGCGIETGWRWRGMEEPIRDNQHNSRHNVW